MYLIGIGAGVLMFVLLQFAGPEEFIRARRKRKGLDSQDPENDFVAEEEAATDDDERPKGTPRPMNAPQPQPPIYAWPAQTPAPPTYGSPGHGPWSTATQQRPPQGNSRG